MASAKVPLLEEDAILVFGDDDVENEGTPTGKLTHPYVTFFHLFFRGASLVIYLFSGLFSDSFITNFVIIVLFLSMDFWTVKNVTGRLMVGLRWWNYVDDDGNSHWVFESRQNRINSKEATIFWAALVAAPVVWGLLFISALFGLKPKWLLLVTIALILSGSNLCGYVKCKIGNSEGGVTSMTRGFLRKQMFQNAATFLAGKATVPT